MSLLTSSTLRHWSRLAAIAIALPLAACGAPPDGEGEGATEEAIVASPIHHVVLLSGGFGSCDPDGARGVVPSEMNAILSDIQTRSGSVPTVVRTCFGGVGQRDRMEFVATEGSTVIRAGSTSVTNLQSFVKDQLMRSKPSRFDAYGHSHGGWLVGRVVQDLGPGDADSFTLNVVLSDAISRPLCTPAVVIFGSGRADYCGRFPLDLTPSTIRANVKGYLGTAWQGEDWLHSSPISGAENITFNPGEPVRPRAFNHRALFTLPLTRGVFRNRFQYR